MTGVEDQLERARKALGPVSTELDLTWDDVVARAEGEQEFVSVLPVGDARATRPSRTRRLAAAAGVAAALTLGVGTTAALLSGRDASPPPAGGGSVAASPAGASADVIADRARDALATTPWCGATLETDTPQTTLALDGALEPSVIEDARGTWEWVEGGTRILHDDRDGTVWKLDERADLVADRPDLQAAVAALRLLVDGGGAWMQAADDGSDTIRADVGATSVVVAVDAGTAIPARLSTTDPAATFAVTWLPCDGAAGP